MDRCTSDTAPLLIRQYGVRLHVVREDAEGNVIQSVCAAGSADPATFATLRQMVGAANGATVLRDLLEASAAIAKAEGRSAQ